MNIKIPEGRVLQGRVIAIEPTKDTYKGEDGNLYTKHIFTVELLRWSKKKEGFLELPEELKGKKVKLVRYTCYDWHLKIGSLKNLTEEETKAVIDGKPTQNVFWD
ncbi:MAG: hypothetical protein QXX95_04455 [Nitrososphaerales archaeon]